MFAQDLDEIPPHTHCMEDVCAHSVINIGVRLTLTRQTFVLVINETQQGRKHGGRGSKLSEYDARQVLRDRREERQGLPPYHLRPLPESCRRGRKGRERGSGGRALRNGKKTAEERRAPSGDVAHHRTWHLHQKPP